MISTRQRVDYGEQLKPPLGYKLSSAIATSYSLDLNTLLTVPIAMCFNETLEGELEKEHLAILEAISQLKGCLKVFYQQGNIKIPAEYHSLFALLEPCLEPIIPDAGVNGNSVYSSYHPKLWLLRFINEDEKFPIKYRLIVLSRNLTFDRSWDLAAVLDGEVTKDIYSKNSVLTEFFANHLKQVNDFKFSESLLSELPFINWKNPAGFYSPEFLPSSHFMVDKQNRRRKPLKITKKDADAMLVISPFIKGGSSIKGLDWLSTFCPHGTKYLFSRADELNSIDKDLLRGWQCYSLNDRITNGEEYAGLDLNEFVENDSNLHAKLIVHDRNETSNWHIGSANATAAALGTESEAPRNTEFMLRLSGNTKTIGVTTLLEQLTTDDDLGLFVKHKFEMFDEKQKDHDENELRRLIFNIIQAKWHIIAELEDDRSYSIMLTCDDYFAINSNFSVQIGLLSVKQEQPFMDNMLWSGLKLSQISCFMPVKIFHQQDLDNKTLLKEFIIQSDLEIKGIFDREKQIINELIDSESKFYNYLSMLLQLSPNKADWLGILNKKTSSKANDSLEVITAESVLFEKLMDSAARNPSALIKIKRLMDKLDQDSTVIPPVFKSLWAKFESFVEEK